MKVKIFRFGLKIMKKFNLYKIIFYGFVLAALIFSLITLTNWADAIKWDIVGMTLNEPFVAKNWHYLLLILVIWCTKKDCS